MGLFISFCTCPAGGDAGPRLLTLKGARLSAAKDQGNENFQEALCASGLDVASCREAHGLSWVGLTQESRSCS